MNPIHRYLSILTSATAHRLGWWRQFLLTFLAVLVVWGVMPAAPAGARMASEEPQKQALATSIRPYLERVIQRVSEFRLDNGIKFIVLERHEAPVVSFLTYADVGGANEPPGKTGVAHFLEHLAFKGSTRIGTKNYKAEKPLLEELDRLDAKIKAAEKAGRTEEATQLQAEFQKVSDRASELVKQNEFGQIVEKEGGVGLNATTSADATQYFYSFPANKLELWMSLESERFLEPVFREFYKERQVILEERRLRTDNSPVGTAVEKFLETAFTTHPYKQPVIGYPEDLRSLTRKDVEDFFHTYYVPNNLTIAVVGDVDPKEVQRLAQIYFGRYQPGPTPPPLNAVEPPQKETREVVLRLPSQPWYFEGYHQPGMKHPDRAVYQLIGSLMSDGRTSRLYKTLVEQKQVALAAQGFSGFPGDKYPNLMLFYAMTAPGHTVDEVATLLHQEIERLKTEPVAEADLTRVKNQARANLLRSLDSNDGMASLLVEYQVKTGDWRNLFSEIEDIEAVTPADIQRVARATFVPENKTIARLLPAK